jgi:hypothetical protein
MFEDMRHSRGSEEPLGLCPLKESCTRMLLLGFLVLVLDIIALVNSFLSAMSVGGKVLGAVVAAVRRDTRRESALLPRD